MNTLLGSYSDMQQPHMSTVTSHCIQHNIQHSGHKWYNSMYHNDALGPAKLTLLMTDNTALLRISLSQLHIQW